MGVTKRKYDKTALLQLSLHCTLNLKEFLKENSCQVLATTTRRNELVRLSPVRHDSNNRKNEAGMTHVVDLRLHRTSACSDCSNCNSV